VTAGTKLLRQRLERDDATAAGVEISRQRRIPTRAERARWCATPKLADCFFTGYHRGRALAARLQQTSLAGVA